MFSLYKYILMLISVFTDSENPLIDVRGRGQIQGNRLGPISSKRMTMSWISDGTPTITSQGAQLKYDGKEETAGALWEDGAPLTSGEHYYTIKFSTLGDGAWVGVTSRDRLKKGYGTKGLFYGGNLSDGGGLLVGSFGPGIKANDVIGLLISFSNSHLQLYIFVNGKPLGLTFEVDASIFPNGVFPVVRFNREKASATIQKETNIPKDRNRAGVSHSGIEGPWKTEQGSIKIDGQVKSIAESDLPTIKFSSAGGNKYRVQLKVINNVNFSIEKTQNSWKSNGPGATTLMGGPPELMQLEQQLSTLCNSPDSVTVDSNKMTVTKGNSSVNFLRYDDTPGPYRKNPF